MIEPSSCRRQKGEAGAPQRHAVMFAVPNGHWHGEGLRRACASYLLGVVVYSVVGVCAYCAFFNWSGVCVWMQRPQTRPQREREERSGKKASSPSSLPDQFLQATNKVSRPLLSRALSLPLPLDLYPSRPLSISLIATNPTTSSALHQCCTVHSLRPLP